MLLYLSGFVYVGLSLLLVYCVFALSLLLFVYVIVVTHFTL